MKPHAVKAAWGFFICISSKPNKLSSLGCCQNTPLQVFLGICMSREMLLATASMLALALWSSDQTVGEPTTPGKKAQLLVNAYEEIDRTFTKELRDAKSREEISAANKRSHDALERWWLESLKLIRDHRKEACILPVIEKHLSGNGVDNAELAGIVRTHHWENRSVGRLVASFYQSNKMESCRFAIDVADSHPNRETRGRAALTIGELAKWELIADQLPITPARRLVLADQRRTEVETEARTYLTKAANEYPDVTLEDTTTRIGPRAAAALVGLGNLPNLQPGRLAVSVRPSTG
jgi:hypothetical protein